MMQKLALPNPLPTAVVVGLTLLIWFVIPVPEGVPPNAWHLFALFTGTIVGIISKAMPLGSLSIIAIGLAAITGVTNPGKPGAALIDALSGFANPLIWLIVVAVMVAVAVTKPGSGRLAECVAKPVCRVWRQSSRLNTNRELVEKRHRRCEP